LEWDRADKELFIEVKAQPAGRNVPKTAKLVLYYENKAQFLESKVGPLVRSFGWLNKIGVPDQEVLRFIQQRLPKLRVPTNRKR